MGQSGVKLSYNLSASAILEAWKVTWRQQHPIPNPIASR